MSHFTVIVVWENVESQLEPFQENNMGDCPEKYLEFVDETDEFYSDYINWFQERVKNPSWELINKYENEIKEAREKLWLDKHDNNIMPEWYELIKTPWKDIYSTFEEYVKEIESYDKPVLISKDFIHIKGWRTNRYWYKFNPNAKWDWYQIWWRWAWTFAIKEWFKKLYDKPNFSLMFDKEEKENPYYKWRTDQIIIDHIDFEKMYEEQADRLWKKYDNYISYSNLTKMTIKDLINLISESDKKDEKPFKDIWDLEKGSKEIIHTILYRYYIWYDKDKINSFKKLSREQYIEKNKKFPISTFAILNNWEWIEEANMWWFWFTSNENSDYDKQFENIIKSLPPDTMLTIVDCHI